MLTFQNMKPISMTPENWKSLCETLHLGPITVDSGTPPRASSVAPVDPVKPKYYPHPDPFTYAFAHDLGPVETNVVKYVTRWKQKGGITDLKKARECLNRLINHETNKKAVPE